MKEPEPDIDVDNGLEVKAGDVNELNAAGRDITQIINNYQNMDKDQLKELVEEMVHASIVSQIEEIDTESPATPEEVAKAAEDEDKVYTTIINNYPIFSW